MKQANFNALKYYCCGIFNYEKSWENFIGQLCNGDPHLTNSKYMRQVILGNCNPNKHIKFEKMIMSKIIPSIIEAGIKKESIVCFTNDEIVVEVDSHDPEILSTIIRKLNDNYITESIPLKTEMFRLIYLGGDAGYLKIYDNKKYKFKCTNNDLIAMLVRYMKTGFIAEEDKIFWHNNTMAKYIETPNVVRDAFEIMDVLRNNLNH